MEALIGIDFANLDWQKTARSGHSLTTIAVRLGGRYKNGWYSRATGRWCGTSSGAVVIRMVDTPPGEHWPYRDDPFGRHIGKRCDQIAEVCHLHEGALLHCCHWVHNNWERPC